MSTTSSIPLPLLITGVAGVAGYNAFHHFHARFPGQVIGIRRADNWRLQGDGLVGCDMHWWQDSSAASQNRQSLPALFDRYEFRSVLNCEGTCALRACELDPLMAWRVNVLGLENLIETVQQRAESVRLVHLSIDLVFSGTLDGDHVETDPPDPVTVYGKTMEQTENLVLSSDPTACVLRISLPMGVSFNGHAGAIDWIQARFQKGKPATLYFDEVRTPTYTDCMNKVFDDLLRNRLSGLFHCGGPRKLSLYQIAQIVNRVGGYRAEHLHGCHRIEAGPMPPRAGDVTMDSRKLQDGLGYAPFDPWPIDEEFVPTDPEWHYRRDTFDGSPELLAEQLYRNPKAN